MINPISFTQSEGFETQKNSLFDAAEAESNGENFTTFFNLSIFAPPTPPIKVAKTENQGETADNVQLENVKQNSQSTLPVNSTDAVLTVETKPAPSTTVTTNPNETVKNNFPIRMINTRREITNTDIIESLRRKFAAPLNGKNLVNVSENQIQPQPQTTVRAQTPTITSTETPSQIFTPNTTRENIETVQENFSKQTNQVVELLNDQNSAEGVKVNFSNNSGQNLTQSERETPKISVEFENSADSSEQILDKFVNAVAKEQQIIEGNRQAQDLSAKVVEQIEPRIIEIANLNRNGNEKKVLKLKLNPEELGSVEITLERTADGRMNAYFQTESEQTRQILNENLAQLRNSLENSGLQIGNLDISNNSFSSGGNENREAFRQQFGTNENQPAATQNFDGNSNKQDDEQSRLVNLRA